MGTEELFNRVAEAFDHKKQAYLDHMEQIAQSLKESGYTATAEALLYSYKPVVWSGEERIGSFMGLVGALYPHTAAETETAKREEQLRWLFSEATTNKQRTTSNLLANIAGTLNGSATEGYVANELNRIRRNAIEHDGWQTAKFLDYLLAPVPNLREEFFHELTNYGSDLSACVGSISALLLEQGLDTPAAKVTKLSEIIPENNFDFTTALLDYIDHAAEKQS